MVTGERTSAGRQPEEQEFLPGLDVTPILLREMKQSDREVVDQLWRTRFDQSTEDVDWVFDRLQNPELHIRGVIATLDTEIVGFGVAFPSRGEVIEQQIYPEYITGLPEIVGMFHIGVVDEEHESEGIGRRLFQDRLNYFQRLGVNSYIGTAWLRPNGHSSAALFEDFGFSSVGEFENFYSEDRDCPECGPGERCHCTARIYVYPDPAAESIEVTM